MEQRSQVDKHDQELVQRAKRILEDVFAVTNLVTKRDLQGESGGRLPAAEPGKGTIRFQRGEGTSGTRQGRTAPRLEATIAEETVKRWGALHRWEAVSMGTSTKRAEIIEENGRLVLIINSDYPLFQAAKRIGDDAQVMYVMESGAIVICQQKTKGQSIEEYIELLNQTISEGGTRLFRRLPKR